MFNGAPRNLRLCFKTTRATYWWVRQTAQEVGLTPSSLIHWLISSWMEKYAGSGPSAIIESIRANLDEEGMAQFNRELAKRPMTSVECAETDLPF